MKKGLVKIALTIIVLTCIMTQSQAQTNIPKYSNDFLTIGIGARAAGMGNAQVGIINDITASYWNPAGLVAVEGTQIGLMHSEYFGKIANYDYVGFCTDIDEKRRFGATAIRLGIDDIPNTLNLLNGNRFDFSKITMFSVADLALILSYAQRSSKSGLSYGVNFKILNRVVGEFATAWGFGLDVGMQYNKGNFRSGLMLSDVTSTFNAWSFNTETFESAFAKTNQVIPQNSIEITLPSATIGMGYKMFADKKLNALITADARMHFDGPRNVLFNAGSMSFDPRVGLEVGYKEMIFIRGGMMNIQKIPDEITGAERLIFYPTAGVGFQLKKFALDYALTNIGDFKQSLYSHLFSLKVSL